MLRVSRVIAAIIASRCIGPSVAEVSVICPTGIGAPSATHGTSAGSMGPLRDGNEIELTPSRLTRTAASSSFAPAEIGCQAADEIANRRHRQLRSPSGGGRRCRRRGTAQHHRRCVVVRPECFGDPLSGRAVGAVQSMTGVGESGARDDILQRSGGRAFGQDPRAQDFA